MLETCIRHSHIKWIVPFITLACLRALETSPTRAIKVHRCGYVRPSQSLICLMDQSVDYGQAAAEGLKRARL
jgi:hypothetical protein